MQKDLVNDRENFVRK